MLCIHDIGYDHVYVWFDDECRYGHKVLHIFLPQQLYIVKRTAWFRCCYLYYLIAAIFAAAWLLLLLPTLVGKIDRGSLYSGVDCTQLSKSEIRSIFRTELHFCQNNINSTSENEVKKNLIIIVNFWHI